jgi:hypothetical protein
VIRIRSQLFTGRLRRVRSRTRWPSHANRVRLTEAISSNQSGQHPDHDEGRLKSSGNLYAQLALVICLFVSDQLSQTPRMEVAGGFPTWLSPEAT